MRIRNIKDGMRDIRSDDPGTSITERALRRALVNGDIRSRRVGESKQATYMFDLDEALQYFGGANIEREHDA